MLRPFYRVAKILEGMTPAVQQLVKDKLPEECTFLLGKNSLDSIRRKPNSDVDDRNIDRLLEADK